MSGPTEDLEAKLATFAVAFRGTYGGGVLGIEELKDLLRELVLVVRAQAACIADLERGAR